MFVLPQANYKPDNMLHDLSLSFPLENPILQFSLILFIILFAPILLNKVKIPHLIGLILAGVLIGPYGLNIMLRDSSIILFGTVGLLYIMFLAGLEIDLLEFRKNIGRSTVFGLYTFIIPMGLGTAMSYYILRFPLPTSILLASMFASHTLIAYPVISKLGVARNRAVTIAVGGTVITDTLALLVLAVIAGMSTGTIGQDFWIRLGLSMLIFILAVVLLFPLITRWFFKRYDDSILQYIFVLGMLFLGAFMAEAAGIEPIIGAFLAGLALNRLIPKTSPLMNRVEFVGNALFIPFFLIGVGMLINTRMFIKDWETIFVAICMTLTATFSKFIAAWFTQKTFRLSLDERRLIFGLSNAQAAATLAAVLVGYNIILGHTETGEPIRLLSESVLNGTILMILVTCTIASFIAQKGARNLALAETSELKEESDLHEKILVAVKDLPSTEELINLSTTIKSPKNLSGLYAITVLDDISPEVSTEKKAARILEQASMTAAATDNHLHTLLRNDPNVVNGISQAVKDYKITDLILGLHEKKGISTSFLGNLTEGILNRCNTTTLIYKPSQPLATVKRHLVIVPEKAEKEIGFAFWIIRLWNVSRNTGARLMFFAPGQTLQIIREIKDKHPVSAEFSEFSDWDDFLILSREVKNDDNLVIILSRKDRPSWHNNMSRIPTYLNKYFQSTSFLLVFPVQSGVADIPNMDLKNPSVPESIEKLDEIGKTISKLFKRK